MPGNGMTDFKPSIWSAVALGSMLLVSCRPLPVLPDNSTAYHVLYSIEWWAPLVKPEALEYLPREVASPAADLDLPPGQTEVIAVTRDHFVRGISPQGKLDWTFQTQGHFVAGPTLRDGVAYVAGGDGTLYALDSRTGRLKWQFDSGEELLTSPVLDEQTVLVATENDALLAVERQSGKLRWRYHRDLHGAAGFRIFGAADPTIHQGTIYIGFSDGSLVALKQSDGTVKWERSLTTEGKQFLDVDTTPIIDASGRLYAASYKDGLYALDSETGAIKWHTTKAGITGLALRRSLLFSSGDQMLGAYLSDSGKQIWSVDLGSRASRRLLVAKGLVIAPTSAALLFVDSVNGRTLSSWNPGKGVTAVPFWSQGRLYVLSNLGYLYALRLHGGR
jgi:outer membrane protein assembly factor BamB